jgi:hypothetical protein
MEGSREGSVGRWFLRGIMPWSLVALLCVSTAGAWPAGVDHSIFADGDFAVEDKPRIDLDEEGPGKQREGQEDSRNKSIVGVSLLGSGLFLCSWGITSWEIEEYQCCPARNTGNVVKIVAGVVLLNAGLIYLLEAGS